MSSLSIRRKIQSRTREFSPKPGQRNFPWKETKFPSDSIMKQIPATFSVEEEQCKVSFWDGIYWTLCYIYFDYFLCLLLCKLIKSFMCTQSNIYKCCSTVTGPCFTELPSPFTAFEVLKVALLSIQVSWKLCCCFVSVIPDSSAITMSGTTHVTFWWSCVRMLNLSTGFFFCATTLLKFHRYSIRVKLGGTDPGHLVTWAIKLCTVVPNICGFSVWNLLCVTFLAIRILR